MMSEKFLSKIKSKTFQVVFLRPSTVFGASPRLRTDIILNNFILNAYLEKSSYFIRWFALETYLACQRFM